MPCGDVIDHVRRDVINLRVCRYLVTSHGDGRGRSDDELFYLHFQSPHGFLRGLFIVIFSWLSLLSFWFLFFFYTVLNPGEEVRQRLSKDTDIVTTSVVLEHHSASYRTMTARVGCRQGSVSRRVITDGHIGNIWGFFVFFSRSQIKSWVELHQNAK